MLNGTDCEVPPPGAGLETVMLSVPATKMSSAEIRAESWELLTNVVGRLPLFHSTSDPDTKPEPFTVNWKAGPSRAALLGEIAPIVGMGLGAATEPADPLPPLPQPERKHMHRKAWPTNSKLRRSFAFRARRHVGYSFEQTVAY